MPRHHYLPVSILSAFASPEAWRLVSASAATKRRIAAEDAAVIAANKTRIMPLCVLDKSSGSLQRRVVSKICSAPNFYSLPSYDDPLLRGIVRHNLACFESGSFTPLTDQELIRLGKDPLELDVVERINLSRMDGAFSALIGPLSRGEPLDGAAAQTILAFLTLARYRSPAWRRVYYPAVHKDVMKRFQPLLDAARTKGWKPRTSGPESEFEAQLELSLFQMSIMQACEQNITALERVKAATQVLHADASSRFVLSDNPGRPYRPDRLRSMHAERLPGVSELGVQVAYPISPQVALVVRADPSLPAFTHVKASYRQVRGINTALAIIAESQVVLPDPSPYHFEPWLQLTQIPSLALP